MLTTGFGNLEVTGNLNKSHLIEWQRQKPNQSDLKQTNVRKERGDREFFLKSLTLKYYGKTKHFLPVSCGDQWRIFKKLNVRDLYDGGKDKLKGKIFMIQEMMAKFWKSSILNQ